MTVRENAESFLAHVATERSAGTRRAYGTAIDAFCEEFGDQDVPDADEVNDWFISQWGDSSAGTWNARKAALSSMAAWWADQPDMPAVNPFIRIGRKPDPENRNRALTRDRVKELLSDPEIHLRERTFWSMLYESAARANEILALDIQDLNMRDKRAQVKRKGGASDFITWRSGTAHKLSRYLKVDGKARTKGPIFVTDRAAKDDIPRNHVSGNLDEYGRGRMSYERARFLFSKHSGGATLHQLRHSALTHQAEDGASAPLLMSISGHTNLRTLGRYAKPGVEAVSKWQQEHDENRGGK